MYSTNDTRCRVGCPIRIPTDQRLLAAPRGFSQRATSFIASWCQGIHRMPFSYSIGATLLRRAASTMHRNLPQSQSFVSRARLLRVSLGRVVRNNHDRRRLADCRTVLEISIPHTTGFSRIAPPPRACAITGRNSTKSFTTPLNPRRQPLGRYPHRQQFPVRQFGRTTDQWSVATRQQISQTTAAGE